MKIERVKPSVLRVTLHTYELSALVATARWVAEGMEEEFPEEAREQLCTVLDSYEKEARRLGAE